MNKFEHQPISPPVIMVAVPTATQNSPFLPQWLPKLALVLIAPTHGRMARLSGLDDYQDGRRPKVTNPVLTGIDVA